MGYYSNRIEVCFISTTQYTFLITDIYSRYLHDNYGIRPIVFCRTFQNFNISKFDTEDKYIIEPYSINNKTIFGQCVFALQCGYLFPFSNWIKLLDRDKRIILFVFNDKSKLTYRMIEFVKNINPENKVLLIEEGTDTYSDTLDIVNEKLWHAKHTISKILFGCGRTSKVIGDNESIEGVIVKDPLRYKKLSKAKNQKVIQQDTDILLSASEFISHYAAASLFDLECDVLYLGQPYYRNGKYYKYEDECVTKILSALPSNLRILIKPHPRDSIDKYKGIIKKNKNISLVSEDLAVIPIETLLGITNTKAVVSIQSSAAITLANLFPNIDSVVLKRIPEAILLKEKLKKAGEEVPIIEDSYFVGKYDNIYIPETMNEYVNLVNTIVSRKYDKIVVINKHHKQLSEIDEMFNEIMEY